MSASTALDKDQAEDKDEKCDTPSIERAQCAVCFITEYDAIKELPSAHAGRGRKEECNM